MVEDLKENKPKQTNYWKIVAIICVVVILLFVISDTQSKIPIYTILIATLLFFAYQILKLWMQREKSWDWYKLKDIIIKEAKIKGHEFLDSDNRFWGDSKVVSKYRVDIQYFNPKTNHAITYSVNPISLRVILRTVARTASQNCSDVEKSELQKLAAKSPDVEVTDEE